MGKQFFGCVFGSLGPLFFKPPTLQRPSSPQRLHAVVDVGDSGELHGAVGGNAGGRLSTAAVRGDVFFFFCLHKFEFFFFFFFICVFVCIINLSCFFFFVCVFCFCFCLFFLFDFCLNKLFFLCFVWFICWFGILFDVFFA